MPQMEPSSNLELRVSRKRATVIGATGLVGRELVAALDDHPAYARVVVLARGSRPPALSDKVVWREMPQLDRFASAWPALETQNAMQAAITPVLPQGDDFFSCLGTTRKAAGSVQQFRYVDLGINLAFAKTAAELGYSQYSLVSSLGADPKSWFSYARTKGELELAVGVLPFWAVHLFRPGLLHGEREDTRLGEAFASATLRAMARLGIAARGKFQEISARTVALAMVDSAQQTSPRVHYYYREEMLMAVGAP